MTPAAAVRPSQIIASFHRRVSSSQSRSLARSRALDVWIYCAFLSAVPNWVRVS